jgi:hypothetical protein
VILSIILVSSSQRTVLILRISPNPLFQNRTAKLRSFLILQTFFKNIFFLFSGPLIQNFFCFWSALFFKESLS